MDRKKKLVECLKQSVIKLQNDFIDNIEKLSSKVHNLMATIVDSTLPEFMGIVGQQIREKEFVNNKMKLEWTI